MIIINTSTNNRQKVGLLFNAFDNSGIGKKIGLFGSYIRGEQTEKSDVDILVDMPEGFDRFFDLKYYLEKHLHEDVDLGKENNLRRFIRKRVANEIVYV